MIRTYFKRDFLFDLYFQRARHIEGLSFARVYQVLGHGVPSGAGGDWFRLGRACNAPEMTVFVGRLAKIAMLRVSGGIK
jgi:hypothetical protein